MFKRKSTIITIVLVGALSACGGKLLWESRFVDGGPKIVTAAAVDHLNNSYTGGSIRHSEDPFDNSALLLKHDAAGVLQWESTLDEATAVIAVEPVSDEYIAIVTGPYLAGAHEELAKSRQLWLVSAATGDSVTLIRTFDPAVDGQAFHKLEVVDGRLYVATGPEKEACDTVFMCIRNEGPSALSVYDLAGNLLDSRTLEGTQIADFEVDADRQLTLLFRDDGSGADVQRWSAELETQWSARSLSAGDTALRFCSPVVINRYQDDTFVMCSYQVIKLSEAGEVVFNSSLESLLSQTGTETSNVVGQEYWLIEGMMELDNQGDVVVAKTRAAAYATQNAGTIGGVAVPSFSTLSYDTVTIKLSGQTGDILWNKSVGDAITAQPSGFKAYTHYPLNLTVEDDNVTVSLRSFGGIYNDCHHIADWEQFVANTCTLVSREDLSGRTVVYNAETGKRIASKRHEVPYPRVALTTAAAGDVLVMGDMEAVYWNRFAEAVANGAAMVEYADPPPLAETSDIIVQKYKF